MARSTIFYVFRRPISKDLNLTKYGKNPTDLYYALTKIKKYHILYTDKVFKYKLLLYLQYLLNLFIGLFYKGGFSLFPTILLISELNKADLIFATVDTYGLPLALLKKLGIIKPKIVLNTIGMYDGLIQKNNKLFLLFIKSIFNNIDHIISVASFNECQKLSEILKFPINKFSHIPLGIDTNFFCPLKSTIKNEILTIGADPCRDWNLLLNTARALPKENFRFITYRNIIKEPIPDNVTLEYNLDYLTIRKRILSAKIFIILAKLNHYCAGQHTAFRAMSCGKPVIFTQNPGTNIQKLISFKNCLLVPPNNLNKVIQAIKYLNKSSKIRKEIGLKARTIIKKEYNINQYANKTEFIFDQILKKDNY